MTARGGGRSTVRAGRGRAAGSPAEREELAMPGNDGYVVRRADRTTLLQGPLGAILLLGGDPP
jgi:hypothetical protein